MSQDRLDSLIEGNMSNRAKKCQSLRVVCVGGAVVVLAAVSHATVVAATQGPFHIVNNPLLP
jgi:hypothetical protein